MSFLCRGGVSPPSRAPNLVTCPYRKESNAVLSALREQVGKIRVGDQVRFRGYLASYSNDTGSKRGTSTTRTDTGNGACETIFVEDFQILRGATSFWRISMWTSLALLLVGLGIHFARPYRPH